MIKNPTISNIENAINNIVKLSNSYDNATGFVIPVSIKHICDKHNDYKLHISYNNDLQEIVICGTKNHEN